MNIYFSGGEILKTCGKVWGISSYHFCDAKPNFLKLPKTDIYLLKPLNVFMLSPSNSFYITSGLKWQERAAGKQYKYILYLSSRFLLSHIMTQSEKTEKQVQDIWIFIFYSSSMLPGRSHWGTIYRLPGSQIKLYIRTSTAAVIYEEGKCDSCLSTRSSSKFTSWARVNDKQGRGQHWNLYH